MMNRDMLRCFTLVALLAVVGAKGVEAQVGRFAVEAEAGVMFPVGQTEDYFMVGAHDGAARHVWGF